MGLPPSFRRTVVDLFSRESSILLYTRKAPPPPHLLQYRRVSQSILTARSPPSLTQPEEGLDRERWTTRFLGLSAFGLMLTGAFVLYEEYTIVKTTLQESEDVC